MRDMIARIFSRVKAAEARCALWIVCHPRTGWYIAVVVTVNFVLNVLDLLH